VFATLDAHLRDVITISAIAATPSSAHLIYATMEYAIDFATTRPAIMTTVNALASPPQALKLVFQLLHLPSFQF
jgi:Tfp pilus assembly ATPase PilU